MHALIIEDEFLVAISIEDSLQALGFTSFETTGTEAGAVAAAQIQMPDLITADVRLANGSGIAAIEAILQQRPVPVVFITGNVEMVQERMPDAIVVQKPFQDETLHSAIAVARERVQPQKLRHCVAA
jgi:two-component system, response regulator PdtaR